MNPIDMIAAVPRREPGKPKAASADPSDGAFDSALTLAITNHPHASAPAPKPAIANANARDAADASAQSAPAATNGRSAAALVAKAATPLGGTLAAALSAMIGVSAADRFGANTASVAKQAIEHANLGEPGAAAGKDRPVPIDPRPDHSAPLDRAAHTALEPGDALVKLAEDMAAPGARRAHALDAPDATHPAAGTAASPRGVPGVSASLVDRAVRDVTLAVAANTGARAAAIAPMADRPVTIAAKSQPAAPNLHAAAPVDAHANAAGGSKHESSNEDSRSAGSKRSARAEAAAMRTEPASPLAGATDSPAPVAKAISTAAVNAADPTARPAGADLAAQLDAPKRTSDHVTLDLQGENGIEGRLRVALRGQSLHATLVTPDPDAVRRLTSEVADLHRALAERGFADARVAIQVTPGEASAKRFGPEEDSNARHHRSAEEAPQHQDSRRDAPNDRTYRQPDLEDKRKADRS